HFQDAYGLNVESSVGCPFDFVGSKKYFLDDEAYGWDVGIIPISPMYRKLMEAHEVAPICMDYWRESLSMPFDFYGLLGLPKEQFHRERGTSVTGTTLIGGARPVFIFAERSEAVSTERPIPTHPW